MSYSCTKYPSLECNGCGDCKEFDDYWGGDEIDDVSEEDLTDDPYEENWMEDIKYYR